jgi:TonB family protein
VLVQSCQVCADNAARPAQEATTQSAATGDPGPLAPLVAPEPTYPAQAGQRGLEGTVTVEFTVNPYGATENVHVVSSQPAGIFDLAAVSAISRWRYRADAERAPVELTETVEFSIDDFLFTQIPEPATQAASDVGSGTDNQCVRETSTWNYGEMVEVGLISACAQPLSVFACAVGNGALAQRWVCTSSEQNSTLLVRPGDPRRGQSVAVATQNGTRSFEYAENFFVARAPNTEYWWMACASDDERCASQARQWSESLNRQAAHIDPQLLTRTQASRSY